MQSSLSIKKSIKQKLSFQEKLSLEMQRKVSRLFFIPLGFTMGFMLKYRLRYSFDNIKQIRKEYSVITKMVKGPLLICSNHLSMIDSIIQAVILRSVKGYFFNFSTLPWNLPEKKNFYRKIHWRTICYLGKCIPVLRGGSPEESKKTKAKIQYVLGKGDVISIFPEGKRSRTSKLDTTDYSYSVGQIIKDNPQTKVMCIYMRGVKNGGFCVYPKKREHFYLDIKLINPKSLQKGMRQIRDLSWQVMNQLEKMEKKYFQSGT